MKPFEARQKGGRAFLALTLPVWIVLFVWMGQSIRNAVVEWGRYAGTDSFGRITWRTVRDGGRAHAIRTRMMRNLRPDRDSPDQLCIDVPEDLFRRLTENLPASGEEWIDVAVNGRRGQLSLRGSQELHWLGDPKSLDLKMESDQLLYGIRRLPLSRKAVLNQYVAYWMAEQAGLLVPEARLFDVFMNDEYYAPLLMVERTDGQMLLRRGLMPGTIFEGESFLDTKVDYIGLPRWMLMDAYLWGLAESGSPEEDREHLAEAMADVLLAAPEQVHAAAARHFDVRELEKTFALHLLCNDFHVDGWHNLRFFRYPFDGRFRPIWWDEFVMGAGSDFPESGTYKMHALWQALIRSPAFMEGVQEAMASFLPHEPAWLAKAREVEAAFGYQGGLVKDAFENPSGALEANFDRMRRWLERIDVRAEGYQIGTNAVLVVRQAGPAAVSLASLSAAPGGWRGTDCREDRNRNGIADGPDRNVPGTFASTKEEDRWIAETSSPLRAGFRFRGIERETTAGMETEPMDYPYVLPGVDVRKLRSAEFVRPDGRTVSVAIEPREGEPSVGRAYSAHPWEEILGQEGKVYRFAAHETHRLTEDLLVEEGDAFEAGEGARFILDAGVSLVFRTRVAIRGTAEHPVTFEPARSDAPWGVVAFQGPGASGSVLEHVEAAGGSHDTIRGVYYSGMVTAYDCEGVEIVRCRFGRNRLGDDTFRAGGAGVDVRGCVFVDSRGDSVDYDFSRGTVSSCTFSNVGNDAIDLMESAVVIADNRIVGTGDKGVSVGNRSVPILVGNRMERCRIGVELKDDSRAMLFDNRLVSCGIAVHGYLKNWRYQRGGWGRMDRNELAANRQDFVLEDGSFVVSGDSVVAAGSAADTGGESTNPLFSMLRSGKYALAWAFRPYAEGFGVASGVRIAGRGEATGSRGSLSLRAGGRDLRYELPVGEGGIGGSTNWIVSVVAKHVPGEWSVRCAAGRSLQAPAWRAAGNGWQEYVFEGTSEGPPRHLVFAPESVLADVLEVRDVELWTGGTKKARTR